jgi:hypothetical protein
VASRSNGAIMRTWGWCVSGADAWAELARALAVTLQSFPREHVGDEAKHEDDAAQQECDQPHILPRVNDALPDLIVIK